MGGLTNSRAVWETQWIPGHPGLYTFLTGKIWSGVLELVCYHKQVSQWCQKIHCVSGLNVSGLLYSSRSLLDWPLLLLFWDKVCVAQAGLQFMFLFLLELLSARITGKFHHAWLLRIFVIIYVYMWTRVHMNSITCMRRSGQYCGVGSLMLPLHGFHELNSCHEVCAASTLTCWAILLVCLLPTWFFSFFSSLLLFLFFSVDCF